MTINISNFAAEIESEKGSFATFTGKSGATYGIVAGPIQNAGPSSYWQPIVAAGHEPVGMDSIVTSAGSGTAPGNITIDYTSLGATKVVSFVVVPDETLAVSGFSAGASVGLTNAVIQLSQTAGVADQVSWNGAAWAFARGAATPFTFVSFTAGELKLSHPTVGGSFGVSLHARSVDGTTRPYTPIVGQTSGVGPTSLGIEFWNEATGAKVTTADTNMKLLVIRGEGGAVDARPVDTTAYPNGNLWVFGIFRTN